MGATSSFWVKKLGGRGGGGGEDCVVETALEVGGRGHYMHYEREWNISLKLKKKILIAHMTKKPVSMCRMILGHYGNNVLCCT